MTKLIDIFEKIIVVSLILLMAVIILLATIDLALIIQKEIHTPPTLPLSIDGLIRTFGAFLLVLVGLELLQTTRVYLEDHTIHAEVVYLAAMIAIARKAIILDVQTLRPSAVLGLAALILALAGGYYLFHLTHKLKESDQRGTSPVPAKRKK